MKARKFKIKVQSHARAKKEFVQMWKAAEKQMDTDSEYDLVISFPDISWLSKVFSPERIRLIQTVKERKPESIYELAGFLGRAQPNVQKDVKELSDLGVLSLERIRKPGQQREVLKPEYNWDGFDVAV